MSKVSTASAYAVFILVEARILIVSQRVRLANSLCQSCNAVIATEVDTNSKGMLLSGNVVWKGVRYLRRFEFTCYIDVMEPAVNG